MRAFVKQRRFIVIGMLAAVVLAGAAMTWAVAGRADTATIGAGGGEGWNSARTVGVSIDSGGISGSGPVKVTFAKPKQKLEPAPIEALVDIIGEPVDITPDRPIAEGKGRVMFKVPADLPREATGKDGQPQRSIHNAGIQVFNEPLQAWIPLETRVEGDLLVADAPHFSLYRAAVTKIGQFKVDVGLDKVLTIDLTATDSLDDLLWKPPLEALRQFARNAAGEFDPPKFAACDKPSKQYTVTYQLGTDKEMADACVIEDNGKHKILIKNGWSFPMAYRTSATSGVAADPRPMDTDFTDFWRNKIAGLAGSNMAFASGLDVGSFTLEHAAPESFTVTGRMSWTGAIIDMELAFFMSFVQKTEVLEQINLMVDTTGCGVSAVQKMDAAYAAADAAKATEVPPKLAEIFRGCLTPKLLEKYKVGELQSSIAKAPRIIPETYQFLKTARHWAATGKDMSEVTFKVDWVNPQILKGLWTNQCGGRDDMLKFNTDNTGIMQQRQYDARNTYTETNTLFHVIQEQGRPLLVVDKAGPPELSKGKKIRVEPYMGGSGLILTTDGDEWAFYKDGIPSPC